MAEFNGILDKAAIRKKLAQQRNELSEPQRELWSRGACNNAAALIEELAVEIFMVYMPFRSELNLSGLIEWGWQSGRKVILPRSIPADHSMTLHMLESWEQLSTGAYGIREPNPEMVPTIESGVYPEIVFVPGLAFDRRGGRLGYGGGYYDRFAASLLGREYAVKKTRWFGAAFEAQLIDCVPLEAHDIGMNGIVTEQKIYYIEQDC